MSSKQSQSQSSSLLQYRKNVHDPYRTKPVVYNGVRLMNHQIFPAYYLKYLFPEQRGLILNHYMGTGKTIAGLHFLHEFSDYKKYIVCPEYLRDVWETEIKKLGMTITTDDITILSYDEFVQLLQTKTNANDRSSSILLVDEAHLLIEKIRFEYDDDVSEKVIQSMSDFYKRLFLTGTPLYNDIYDIIYLVNLVEGKEILPYELDIFHKMYFKQGIVRDNIHVLLESIMDDLGLKKSPLLSPYQVSNATRRKIEVKTQQDKLQSEYVKTRNYYITQILVSLGVIVSGATLMGPVVLPIVSAVTFLTIAYIVYYSYFLDSIKNIYIEKLTQTIQPYISYFNPLADSVLSNTYRHQLCRSNEKSSILYRMMCKEYDRRLDASVLPSFEVIRKKITYTEPQYELFIRFCMGEMTPSDVSKMGNVDTSGVGSQDYLQNGRVISNLSVGNITPPKFYQILDMTKGKQTVIYSHYYQQGILSFAKLLSEYNRSYGIVDITQSPRQNNKVLKQFEDGDIQYVLLHPLYTHGINVYGAEQFHILEPPLSHPKLEQLYSRVIRYRGKPVIVYVWTAVVLPFYKTFYKKIKGMVSKTSVKTTSIWKKLEKVNTDCSPDSIVWEKLEDEKIIFRQFLPFLQKGSVETCHEHNDAFRCDMPVAFRRVSES